MSISLFLLLLHVISIIQIKNWADTKSIHEYWIGLRASTNGDDGNRIWKWESRNHPLLNLWKTGEPNNKDNSENCAQVGWGGSGIGDIKCNAKLKVICDNTGHDEDVIKNRYFLDFYQVYK